MGAIYSDDFLLGEQIKDELEEKPWCEDASYQSVFDIGAFIMDEQYVAKDLKEFQLLWWGAHNPLYFFREDEEEKFYGFPLKIVGIEDSVFEEYLYTIGGKWEKDAKYPVIIDDYIPVKNEGEAYAIFREVFEIPAGEEISIQFGKYADYFISMETMMHSEDEEITLHICGVTKNRAPIPVMPGAYGLVRDDLTQMPSYYVKAYMPYSGFAKFLQDERIKCAYGKLAEYVDEYDNPARGISENPILNYVSFNRAENVSEKQIINDITSVMRDSGIRSYVTSYEENYINDSNSWEYGNIERYAVMKQKS